jgi:prepilin-type N-terminal cleavage/methylation domain-containing protein
MCPQRCSLARPRTSRLARRGFTLIEVLIGASIMSLGLLAIAGMLSTGYTDVTAGGKTTMAVTGARQLLEDLRTIRYERLADFNGFRTDNVATLPPADAGILGRDVVREVARKWVYNLRGNDPAWGFTAAERARWEDPMTRMGQSFGATGTVAVDTSAATLRLVIVTVTLPGQPTQARIATLITRL